MLKILATMFCVFDLHFPHVFAQEGMTLPERQKFQEELDSKYFEINQGFEKLRHVLLHLVKTTGKMATYCESKEHGRDADASIMINEVLPDLLMHALQIANYCQVDLDEKYDERVKFIIKRAEAARGKIFEN